MAAMKALVNNARSNYKGPRTVVPQPPPCPSSTRPHPPARPYRPPFEQYLVLKNRLTRQRTNVDYSFTHTGFQFSSPTNEADIRGVINPRFFSLVLIPSLDASRAKVALQFKKDPVLSQNKYGHVVPPQWRDQQIQFDFPFDTDNPATTGNDYGFSSPFDILKSQLVGSPPPNPVFWDKGQLKFERFVNDTLVRFAEQPMKQAGVKSIQLAFGTGLVQVCLLFRFTASASGAVTSMAVEAACRFLELPDLTAAKVFLSPSGNFYFSSRVARFPFMAADQNPPVAAPTGSGSTLVPLFSNSIGADKTLKVTVLQKPALKLMPEQLLASIWNSNNWESLMGMICFAGSVNASTVGITGLTGTGVRVHSKNCGGGPTKHVSGGPDP